MSDDLTMLEYRDAPDVRTVVLDTMRITGPTPVGTYILEVGIHSFRTSHQNLEPIQDMPGTYKAGEPELQRFVEIGARISVDEQALRDSIKAILAHLDRYGELKDNASKPNQG